MTPEDEQVAESLRGLGYTQQTNGADGAGTVWLSPADKDGKRQPVTQAIAAQLEFGTASPYAVSAADNTPTVDGAGVAYVMKNGQAYRVGTNTPYNPVPVPVNQHPGFTSSSSTTTNLTPQRVTQTEIGPDGRTYSVIRDAVTGQEIARSLSGFAPLSPEQQFENDKALAAAGDAAAMARVQAQGQTSRDVQSASDTAAAARQAASDAASMDRLGFQTAGNAAISAGNDTEANRRALLTEQQQNARAGLNAQVQGFQSVNTLAPQLGQLALSNAQFTKDTLANPADFLARSFFTRGQTSPLPQVSQADVINQLTKNIADYQGALSGFNQNFGGFNAQLPNVATVAPAVGFNSRAAAPAAGGGGAAAPAASGATYGTGDYSQAAMQARIDAAHAGTPAMAHGGFTTTPVARVGDDPSGAPNTTEETLLNPTHAPIGIVPNPATEAGGGAGVPAPKANPAETAIIKAIGFVPTKLQHELVDELAKLKTGPKPPRFAYGTGVDGSMGFTAPVLPTQGATTQDALKALEASTRPPALNSILAGGAPNDLQLGFATPSKMAYGDLTPDEKTAFGTTLATQYNLAPSDVETAINQRYSTGSRGVAGFTGA